MDNQLFNLINDKLKTSSNSDLNNPLLDDFFNLIRNSIYRVSIQDQKIGLSPEKSINETLKRIGDVSLYSKLIVENARKHAEVRSKNQQVKLVGQNQFAVEKLEKINFDLSEVNLKFFQSDNDFLEIRQYQKAIDTHTLIDVEQTEKAIDIKISKKLLLNKIPLLDPKNELEVYLPKNLNVVINVKMNMGSIKILDVFTQSKLLLLANYSQIEATDSQFAVFWTSLKNASLRLSNFDAQKVSLTATKSLVRFNSCRFMLDATVKKAVVSAEKYLGKINCSLNDSFVNIHFAQHSNNNFFALEKGLLSVQNSDREESTFLSNALNNELIVENTMKYQIKAVKNINEFKTLTEDVSVNIKKGLVVLN